MLADFSGHQRNRSIIPLYLVQQQPNSRSLRSAMHAQLVQPRSSMKCNGNRTLITAAPRDRKALPHDITDMTLFKSRLRYPRQISVDFSVKAL